LARSSAPALLDIEHSIAVDDLLRAMMPSSPFAWQFFSIEFLEKT